VAYALHQNITNLESVLLCNTTEGEKIDLSVYTIRSKKLTSRLKISGNRTDRADSYRHQVGLVLVLY